MKISNWMAAALAAAAGLATPALAQDSVSNTPGLPGDALDAYTPATQRVAYAVDLVPFQTSRGTIFGVAPLIKASKGQPDFFNHLMSAQAISRTQRFGVAFPAVNYAVWSNPGQGVNATTNDGTGFVSLTGEANRFAVAFNEFGGPAENVIGGVVHYDPADPNRLYVERVAGAQNGTAFGEGASALGGVSVDSDGNVHFRADDFGITGTTPAGSARIVGNNVFRTDLSARGSVVNLIDNFGGADATTRLVRSSGTGHTVPSIIPAQLAGRPVYTGPNFAATLITETSPGVVSGSSAHLAGGTDHRGAIGLSEAQIFPGSVATLGVLTKSVPGGGQTDSISVWGADANGAVVGARQLTVPVGAVSDPVDPFTLNLFNELGHYRSQTAFRGGVGQVALGQDANGDGLAAGVAYLIGGANDPSNAFVVARFRDSGPAAWSVAAWVDATVLGQWPTGKPIRDAAGDAIGELTTLFQVTGGAPFGPSISAPAFDSAGNVWFVSAVQIFVGDNDDLLPFSGLDVVPPAGDDIYTNALIRGVYDAGTFSWDLELVFRLGDTFTGANSGTDYTITFLSIADNDSVSSGTFFSGNVLESTWNGTDTTGLPTSDPRHTGGVVVSAQIAYNTAPVEEQYNVLLFVSPVAEDATPCPGDINNSGAVDGGDLLILLNDFGNGPNGNGNPIGNPGADLNGDGVVNGTDLLILLNGFGLCPE